MLSGKLRPGVKLQEDVLGETFDVSRTTIRKVLLILSQEGLVDLPANHGAFIATPTPVDAANIFEIIRLLACYIVQQLSKSNSVQRAKDEELLHLHISAQAEAEDAKDFVASRLLSGEFLILLSYIYGNKLLMSQMEAGINRTFMCVTLYQRPSHHTARHAFQSNIAELIFSQQGESAAQLLRDALLGLERTLQYAADAEPDLRALLKSGTDF